MSLIKRLSASGPSPRPTNEMWELRTRVQTRLLSEADPSLDALSVDGRRALGKQLNAILAEEYLDLNAREQKRLLDTVIPVIR